MGRAGIHRSEVVLLGEKFLVVHAPALGGKTKTGVFRELADHLAAEGIIACREFSLGRMILEDDLMPMEAPIRTSEAWPCSLAFPGQYWNPAFAYGLVAEGYARVVVLGHHLDGVAVDPGWRQATGADYHPIRLFFICLAASPGLNLKMNARFSRLPRSYPTEVEGRIALEALADPERCPGRLEELFLLEHSIGGAETR